MMMHAFDCFDSPPNSNSSIFSPKTIRIFLSKSLEKVVPNPRACNDWPPTQFDFHPAANPLRFQMTGRKSCPPNKTRQRGFRLPEGQNFPVFLNRNNPQFPLFARQDEGFVCFQNWKGKYGHPLSTIQGKITSVQPFSTSSSLACINFCRSWHESARARGGEDCANHIIASTANFRIIA